MHAKGRQPVSKFPNYRFSPQIRVCVWDLMVSLAQMWPFYLVSDKCFTNYRLDLNVNIVQSADLSALNSRY